MPFLRAEKKSSGTYLRLVESYRAAGGVKHRTLYTLGKLEDFKPRQLEALGRKFLALSGCPVENSGALSAQELGRYNYGYPLVVHHLLRTFGLDRVLERLDRRHKLSYSLFDCLSLMLCDRLQEPLSKLGSHDFQTEYLGLEQVQLQHLYRSLGYFSQHRELLQRHLFEQQRRLVELSLDLVFYDVTTFYFDSEAELEGSLRQTGFGKDGKIGKTQVLFGLLVDVRGNPVGYRVYAGDTYEGHTLSDAVQTLRREYNLRRIVVVTDSGMMNRDNLALFQNGGLAGGFEYIVADRLKNLKAPAQEYLCDLKNYDQTIVHAPDGSMIPLRYAVLEYEGRLLLSTYSDKRAKKDAYEREKKIQKGLKLLQNPTQIVKKAKRFYLKNAQSDPVEYELDQQKIERDARFDGFLVLATNALDLTAPQILQKYKDLYHVEQSFRTFKSFLETRPMFHWNDERIQGHLCMCYIAYCLLAYLKNTLQEESVEITENKIRRMLAKMQVSKIQNDQETFFLRSFMDNTTREILGKLQIPTLSDVIPVEKLAGMLA